MTVHLTQRLKDNLEKLKKNRYYGEVINEVIEGTFNLDHEIKTLPISEAVIQYIRGFNEAVNKFAVVDECSKCRSKMFLWKDGKCIICHGEGLRPNFSYFRDKESAKVLSDKDFKNANVKLPAIERLSYENGRKRGQDEGFDDAYNRAREEFEITYPCSVCGKPMTMKPGSESHKEMMDYMKEQGWRHKNCGE